MINNRNIKISVLLVIFWVITFSGTIAEAQLQVVLSDANLVFRAEQGTTVPVNANTVIRVNVESDSNNWSVNYQAQPLTGTAGSILPGNILIQSPYTQGYESADTLRLAATGDIIGPPAQEVSTIAFQLQLTGTEQPGTYTGILTSPDGAPSIQMRLIVEKPAVASPQLSPNSVSISAAGGPGVFRASQNVVLTKDPSITPTVRIEATPLTSGKNQIQPDSILINNDPAKGVHTLPSDNILKFSIQTGWGNAPGTYTGQVRFIFADSSEQAVKLNVNVSSYTFLSLSPNAINFVAPKPGTHDANQTVDLTVGASVARWSVKAEGKSLKGVNVSGSIPSKRIFIQSIPKGEKVSGVPGSDKFQDLGQERLLVKGTSREPSVASELSFQLKTLMSDEAGNYKGKIRFTLLENP